MTRKQYTQIADELKEALGQDQDPLRPMVQGLVQDLLGAEMDECLGAGRYERTARTG